MRGVRIVVLVAALALAGCGNEPKTGLTPGQAQGLVAQLQAARTTAAAGDLAGARFALASFRRSVTGLSRDGALSAATARSLRIGAQRVLDRIESDAQPAPQPATTTTTPAPAPPPKKEKEHGKGKKKHGKKK